MDARNKASIRLPNDLDFLVKDEKVRKLIRSTKVDKRLVMSDLLKLKKSLASAKLPESVLISLSDRSEGSIGVTDLLKQADTITKVCKVLNIEPTQLSMQLDKFTDHETNAQRISFLPSVEVGKQVAFEPVSFQAADGSCADDSFDTGLVCAEFDSDSTVELNGIKVKLSDWSVLILPINKNLRFDSEFVLLPISEVTALGFN